MSAKKVTIGLAALLLIIAALVLLQGPAAQAQNNGSSQELAAISEKTEKILKDQKVILKTLSSIQEQLEVIRIRITQNQ